MPPLLKARSSCAVRSTCPRPASSPSTPPSRVRTTSSSSTMPWWTPVAAAGAQHSRSPLPTAAMPQRVLCAKRMRLLRPSAVLRALSMPAPMPASCLCQVSMSFWSGCVQRVFASTPTSKPSRPRRRCTSFASRRCRCAAAWAMTSTALWSRSTTLPRKSSLVLPPRRRVGPSPSSSLQKKRPPSCAMSPCRWGARALARRLRSLTPPPSTAALCRARRCTTTTRSHARTCASAIPSSSTKPAT